MSSVDFADRYALAGLQPGADVIAKREASARRIMENATYEQVLDLVSACYGLKPDLTWFRDELRQEDQVFSLHSGERETVIIAAAILGTKVSSNSSLAILGVIAGSVQEKRPAGEANWLLDEARGAMKTRAVTNRAQAAVPTPIKHNSTSKLTETIEAAGADPALLAEALLKVRTESQDAAKTVAKQATDAIVALRTNTNFLREESQILWWLFGEHSRSSGKPFNILKPGQAALLAGIELAELCTASYLGPAAAPAVLERVLRGAKKDTKQITLASAVDGLGEYLAALKLEAPSHPALCPVLTALIKAQEIGKGSWRQAFNSATGLDPDMGFEPSELANQVYVEHLLGPAK